MKVKTNLSPGALRKVGVGLQKLADQQQSEIELENRAEHVLIDKAEALFDTAMNNLHEEVERILLDKEV
jgi:hypothetical protein